MACFAHDETNQHKKNIVVKNTGNLRDPRLNRKLKDSGSDTKAGGGEDTKQQTLFHAERSPNSNGFYSPRIWKPTPTVLWAESS